MRITSSCKLLLILLTQAIHDSEHTKHVNEGSIIAVCKGNDVNMHWKVDEKKDEIRSFDWYFNDKTICNSSPVENFTVESPYQGRIERISKTDLRLKNVSLDDEGTYILFPLLKWSRNKKMEIFIQVLEPPTDKCTCKMGPHPVFKCELPESDCGRPKVSVVWRRRQTFEVLGEGNWSMNSTLHDKEILYCLDGEAMKCADDYRRFCTTVSFNHQDNDRPTEDGKTQHTDSVTVPVSRDSDHESTSHCHIQKIDLVIYFLVQALTIIVILVVFKICCRNGKVKKAGVTIISMFNMFRRIFNLCDTDKAERKSNQWHDIEEKIPLNQPISNSKNDNMVQKDLQPEEMNPLDQTVTFSVADKMLLAFIASFLQPEEVNPIKEAMADSATENIHLEHVLQPEEVNPIKEAMADSATENIHQEHNPRCEEVIQKLQYATHANPALLEELKHRVKKVTRKGHASETEFCAISKVWENKFGQQNLLPV